MNKNNRGVSSVIGEILMVSVVILFISINGYLVINEINNTNEEFDITSNVDYNKSTNDLNIYIQKNTNAERIFIIGNDISGEHTILDNSKVSEYNKINIGSGTYYIIAQNSNRKEVIDKIVIE